MPGPVAFHLHTSNPMIDLVARPVAWLVQQGAALPDTLVMKTVPVQRGWFDVVTGIASAVLTLTMLGLTVVLAPAAWSFWRTFRKVRELLDRVYADVTPLTRHASNIADNLDYITTSIRHDVQQVNATIAAANQRLHEAVISTEDRLNEFNALLQVVQQEAEQAFVSTAAAVRGVRTGAATLSGLDTDADAAVNGDDGGIDDGNDDETDEDAFDEDGNRLDATRAPARPRIRARRRG
jgi:uncharacterized protein YoxC